MDKTITKDIIKIMDDQKKKIDKINDLGAYAFGKRFDKKDDIKTILKEDMNVKTAGRILSYRRQGKAGFGHIMDEDAKIQYYVSKDTIGEENYEIYKLLNVGDHIGIEGVSFYTNTGELTIKVSSFEVLSKSLRPLPEKYHGLKDVETRYRHRYLDLIMNQEVKETFKTRHKIIGYMRNYLCNSGFIEVETPMMHAIPGGALAKPFVTYHETLDMELFLRIAPELYLKKLIVGGYERVFEINRNFRNEGISTRHNPEFTSMELYQAYADYKDMMNITEDLISNMAKDICGSEKINYQDVEINLARPWRRVTMTEAVMEVTGHDFSVLNEVEAKKIAINMGLDAKHLTKYEIMNLIFEEKVEERLIQPTFVYGYPKEISPLAKRSLDNPELSDRFELFIYGRELANAYSELNDPMEQKANFESQLDKRDLNDEAHRMDDDFIQALEHGMPPTGGLGIGIDRLVMLLTNSGSIRDVILFPQMRKK